MRHSSEAAHHRSSSVSVARLLAGAAVVAVLIVAGPAARADGGTFSFGLWGDMPYARAKDQPKIAPLIADMSASDIAFSLYDGDIKDGSSKCSDDVYTDAIKMFDALQKPAVYVPGDNEWTDCHRTNNGGYDNLERLTYLRKMAFASPNITAYAVEATEFPDLAHRYGVNGVPKTVVATRSGNDDVVEILGALPQDDFVEQALGIGAHDGPTLSAERRG